MNRVIKLFLEVLKPVITWALIVVLFISQGITAEAKRSSLKGKPCADLSAGISDIVSPVTPLGVDKTSTEARVLGNSNRSSEAISASSSSSSSEESKLVMSKGAEAMYILATPDGKSDEDSNRVGVLYKDCGGKILERKDGWTKLSSGDVIGWAKDDDLLFDEDAEKLASEVGKQIVTNQSSALKVRAGDSDDAKVIGVLGEKSFVDMIEDMGNGWIAVDYNDHKGFVQAEYVSSDFKIDQGKSMAAIKMREIDKGNGVVQSVAVRGVYFHSALITVFRTRKVFKVGKGKRFIIVKSRPKRVGRGQFFGIDFFRFFVYRQSLFGKTERF